jgi:glutamate N-acetyltransferase/amino-acid N-acetyltransferase
MVRAMKIPGFRFSAVAAGIKKHGGPDLALLAADEPVPTAGMFTRNIIRAAPVQITERRVQAGHLRAILVNSGNANAFTGAAGTMAAERSSAALAEALGCPEAEIGLCSTGVIGQVLPAEKIVAKAKDLVAGLDEDGMTVFADAILTTDRFRKTSELKLGTSDKPVHFAGICKGAGMIHPDLGGAGKLPRAADAPHATMLAFIVTDAVASKELLTVCLERAVSATFNAVSVDGDTSTNDTVLVMASGRSGVSLCEDELTDALTRIARPLARAMVEDGEGAEHLVDITVRGLKTNDECRTVARTIATSPLVKTALAGKDANWGRLVAAAGRSGVDFDAAAIEVRVGGIVLYQDGAPRPENDAAANEKMREASYEIELRLGPGSGSFTYTTCDLGHKYIDVNAGYRS